MEFTYTVRLKMDGDFPGAPDYDEYVVPESVYALLKGHLDVMPGLTKLSDSNPLALEVGKPKIISTDWDWE